MFVHRHARICVVVLALTFACLPLFGQAQPSNLEDLRRQIEQRYTVLPIQNGIVLSPKNKNGALSVEISGNTVAVNGAEVTGGELRSRLGSDADLILQLSYLAPSARQALFAIDGNTSNPQVTPAPARRERRSRGSGRKNDVIRFGGDVTVAQGEIVDGDVVVFGGNGSIDGRVNGDVVVLGGSLMLGPEADISGDVVTVGGKLSRDPGARIGREVNEISGPGSRLRDIVRNRSFFWSGMLPAFTTVTTFVRLGVLVLFGCMVMLVAERLTNRVGDRAAAEPVRAGLTGLLAELLFLPALILTVVLLVITILGIPLLLLIPFAVLGLAVVFLVGFTGVAARVGHLIGTRLGWTSMGPYLTTALGIVVLLLPIVLARLLELAGLNFISVPLLAAGVLIEYLAWTVGFGAAALTYFKPAAAPPPPAPPQTGLTVI
jgi:hypothetical protein